MMKKLLVAIVLLVPVAVWAHGALLLAPTQLSGGTVTGNQAFGGQTSHVAYAQACATSTDDFDINWDGGNIVLLDMEACDQDANDINAPSNPTESATYTIIIEQSTAGTEDLTWNAVFLWPGGTAPVLTQTNNARDVVSCVYADAIYHCAFSQDFQ